MTCFLSETTMCISKENFIFCTGDKQMGECYDFKMAKQFTRTIENFICEHCGSAVKGNGYTNHCPKCLWSKHVDINPGDRGSRCGRLMKPSAAFVKKGRYNLSHTCLACGFTNKNILSSSDNFEIFAQLPDKSLNDNPSSVKLRYDRKKN